MKDNVRSVGKHFICAFCKKRFESKMAVYGHQRTCLYAKTKKVKPQRDVTLSAFKSVLDDISDDADNLEQKSELENVSDKELERALKIYEEIKDSVKEMSTSEKKELKEIITEILSDKEKARKAVLVFFGLVSLSGWLKKH